MTLLACAEPPPPLPPLDAARHALASGDGFGAEIALRKMVDDGTPAVEVAAYLGEAELLQGQLVEARRWLGAGGFTPPTEAHGYHMLGRLEMQAGNLAAAGQAFDRSWRAFPDSAALWVDIGRLRFRGGEQAQAFEASRRAVELDPDDARVLQFRAQLVREAQGLTAALPWFEAAVERNPNDVELLGDYAATLGDLGHASEMLAVVRRMAELEDHNPRVFYLQAVLAARADRFDLARTLLGHLGQNMADVPAVMLLSGIVDLENGNHESAAQTFDRLATLQPDNSRVRDLLARAIAMGLNERELVYRFGQHARSKSASPYFKTALARGLEALDDRAAAAPLLDAAASTCGTRLAVLAARTGAQGNPAKGGEAPSVVRSRIDAGAPVEAITAAHAFLQGSPGSADAAALAGDAYLANGDTTNALSHYRRAASIRWTWPVTQRMAAAYRAAGRPADASRMITRFARAKPHNGDAAVELGRFAAETRDWKLAAMWLDQAIDHGAGRDPVAWNLRSLAARELGDFELASQASAYAHALQPMRSGPLLMCERHRAAS